MATATQTEHTLNLTAGVMRVQFLEAPDAVRVSITGARPRGFEKEKVRRFMLRIVEPYETDRRPMEISGANSSLVGHIQPVGADAWVAYARDRHDREAGA